jgi:oxalate decarboxylase/phosphoglucose isomerase-like protein (cupin superfamily)
MAPDSMVKTVVTAAPHRSTSIPFKRMLYPAQFGPSRMTDQLQGVSCRESGQCADVMTLYCLNPNAAGVDVGATEIYIAVPVDRDPQPVRHFSAFTGDLHAAANWLKTCKIEAEIPGPLEEDRRIAAGPLGPSPIDFAFRTMQFPPTKRNKSGEVRIIDSSMFKASTAIAAAIVTVKPGGRELHWHPNADEWQYFFSGKGRMTVFATGGRVRTMDFETGDVGYVQKTLPHYVENVGTSDLKFLEMFKSSYYQDLALSEWLAHTPPELVAAHLHLDKATLNALPREKALTMPE